MGIGFNSFEDIPFEEKDIEMLGKLCCANVDGCVQIGADFITSKAYINDRREIISSAAKASATIDAKANASTIGESVASNKDAFADNDNDNRRKNGKRKTVKVKAANEVAATIMIVMTKMLKRLKTFHPKVVSGGGR